jgi:hypothetical protein
MKFELDNGNVVGREDGGRTLWRGKPDGYAAKAIAPLLGSHDMIVLLDYMAGPKNFANLIRLAPDGRVVWRLAPPEGPTNDAYVDLRWRGDELVANSWSGYLVRIDPASGRMTSSEFVK